MSLKAIFIGMEGNHLIEQNDSRQREAKWSGLQVQARIVLCDVSAIIEYRSGGQHVRQNQGETGSRVKWPQGRSRSADDRSCDRIAGSLEATSKISPAAYNLEPRKLEEGLR